MDIVSEKRGEIAIVSVTGRFDLTAAPAFEQLVADLIAGGARKLLFDCSGLAYVSSSGLGAFVKAAKLMGDQGSIAFCGLSPHISKVFDMTGFLKLFLVYPSQDSALSAMA